MSNFVDRMNVELSDLEDKLHKLIDFTRSDSFKNLDDLNQGLLVAQAGVMNSYVSILKMRISINTNGKNN